MRISDWSSDVCSSDPARDVAEHLRPVGHHVGANAVEHLDRNTCRMIRRAQHDRRDCGNETQLRDTARAVAGDVAGDFPAPGRAAEPRYLFEGAREIVRASGRGRVWQFVVIWVGGVSLNKKK